ncbi:MAG: hypothetical protein LBM70_02205 [Victivallales bacterium]|jgi:hypothetical protein|nr:hypothetical protein [Victivallales bacterium]
MSLHRNIYCIAASCLLYAVGGCAVRSIHCDNSEVVTSPVLDLRKALDYSLQEQLDSETVESLRLIADEHVNNSMLLRLGALRDEYRSPSPPSVKNSLFLLDGAIAYNYILSVNSGVDLTSVRRMRVKQLLELSGAETWAKLAAVQQKIRDSAGAEDPKLVQIKNDLLLELRIATNLDNTQLLLFDFSSLPMPQRCEEALGVLQQRSVQQRSETFGLLIPPEFPKKINRLYADDPAAIPKLAEELYRLPRKIKVAQLNSPECDFSVLSALGSAAGIIYEVELSYRELEAAWENYKTATVTEMKNQQTDALLRWRIAYFELLAACGGSLGEVSGDTPKIKISNEQIDAFFALWVSLKTGSR